MSDDPTTEPADREDPFTDVWARDTAPQTPYTTRQVTIGLLFLIVGAAIAFGVPLAMT